MQHPGVACPDTRVIEMHNAIQEYFEDADDQDKHNRVRQDDLDIEKCNVLRVGANSWRLQS